MKDWNGAIGRDRRIGEATLWTGAAITVLAVHFGAAAWIMRERPSPLAEAPPATIAMELAPMPVAQEAEEMDLPPDDPMEERADSAPVEEPDEEPDEIVEEEPVEEVVEEEVEPEETQPEEVEEPIEDEIDPIEEVIQSQLDEVEVPIPQARPDPPQQQAQAPAQPSVPAPRTAAPPQVEAEQSEQTAAPQSTRGEQAPQVAPAQWQSQLLAHLERHKRYPLRARSRREEGTVQLRFTLDDAGNVSGASIASSSGHPDLDQAVLDMVARASPVPAPPAGINRNLVVPVRFSLQ